MKKQLQNKITENNSAYINGANLHKGMNDLGWQLDYKRFRISPSEKCSLIS